MIPKNNEFFVTPSNPQEDFINRLVGFSGSSGLLLCSRLDTALFVDGRYRVQARHELNPSLTICELTRCEMRRFVEDVIKKQGDDLPLFFEPLWHSLDEIQKLKSLFKGICELRSFPILTHIKDLFQDDILLEKAPYTLYPEPFHEYPFCEKVKRLSFSTDALLLTRSESVNWLFNIRGKDLKYTPLACVYALFHKVFGTFFIGHRSSLTLEVTSFLDEEGISFLDFKDASTFLKGLSGTLTLDPCSTPYLYQELLTCEILYKEDPCLEPSSICTPREQRGICHAHRLDAIAFLSFMHWIDQCVEQGLPLDEIKASSQLEAFRCLSPFYKGPSFQTISAFGPNGAIVHYHSTPQTNMDFGEGIYLCDSGGQYLEGTTDMTRSFWISYEGNLPSNLYRLFYTAVLKGHIALATIHFPKGTCGAQLDVLARQFLWSLHECYAHGTGHGVGHYLGVHDGCQRIGKGGSSYVLKEGMVLSNEPGFYKEGDFGIRLENLMLVTPSQEAGWFCFETLSLVPFDPNLIDVSHLSTFEKTWIQSYHERIFNDTISDQGEPLTSWYRRRFLTLF